MNKTTIQKILSKNHKEIRKKIKTGGIVTFDDGVDVYLSAREIIITATILSILKIIPKKLKIDSRFNVTNYYVNGMNVSSSNTKFFSAVYEHAVVNYLRDNHDDEVITKFMEMVFVITNEIYNKTIYGNLDYMTDLDIRDFLELQFDERVMKSLDYVKDELSVSSINESYTILDGVMRDEKYLHNRVAEGYIAGTMSANQLMQMLGPRGFLTEINSQIFKRPISASYALGLYDPYDFIVETRSGGKALYLSTVAVEKSEYFAREWQLVTTIVSVIGSHDCGSTDYMLWKIRPSEETNGKSDLINLQGKWYMDDDGTLKVIDKKDKHLEGRTIRLRSAHKCKLENRNVICSKCFGELSYGVFKHSGLGHFTAVKTSSKSTQGILSTKHHTGSAEGRAIQISDEDKVFFTIKNNNEYHIRASVNLTGRTKYRLIINQEEGHGLKDLNSNIDPSKINPARMSGIHNFIIEMENDKGVTLKEVCVKTRNTIGVLSKEFMSYVIDNGYELDHLDRYVIDMTRWDKKNPLLYTPEKEFNFLELSNEIKAMFKSMPEPVDVDALVQKLFDTANSKLNINIALLETIVYGFSCYDYNNKDFRLSRGGTDIKATKIETNIVNRSLSAAYGWERVLNTILNPNSYYKENHINHPLDVYFDPQSTVEAFINGEIIK